MKASLTVVVLLLGLGQHSSYGAKPVTTEIATAQIEACLRRNEVSDRACRNLNSNIDVLIRAYRNNDKSVLPLLLKFTYLTDFFDEALLADSDGFLSAVNALPSEQQKSVAEGIAGGLLRYLTKDRFAAVKRALESVPIDSPNRVLVDVCLRSLLTRNASLFIDYFPPDTFAGPASGYIINCYSRVLYGLDEQPLWQVDKGEKWRFTQIDAWGSSRTVSLSVRDDGTGAIHFSGRDSTDRTKMVTSDSIEISPDQVRRFLGLARDAQFWDAPTQIPSNGRDGAEWLLEGVKDGRYHAVARWCPGLESQSVETIVFAKACRLLLEYAGHPSKGSC